MANTADGALGSIVGSVGFTIAGSSVANAVVGVGVAPWVRPPQRVLAIISNPGSYTALTVKVQVYRGATWADHAQFGVVKSGTVTQAIDDWPGTTVLGSTRFAISNDTATTSGQSTAGWLEVWRVR